MTVSAERKLKATALQILGLTRHWRSLLPSSIADARLVALVRRALFGPHLIAVADQAVVSAASFLTVVIIGRFTDAGELGTYAIAISILATSYTIQGQLVSLPYSILGQRREDGTAAERAGGSLALATLLATAAMLVLAIAASGLFVGGAGPVLVQITWTLAAIIPFALFRDFARRFAFTHLRMAEALFVDAAAAVLQLGMLVGLGLAGYMSAVNASIAFGLSCGIAALGWGYLARDQFVIRARQVRLAMQESWGLGSWLVLNQIVVQIQRFSPYWLCIIILSAGATGVLSACMSIVGFLNPVLYGLNNILTQKSILAWKNGGAAGLRQRTVQDVLLLAAALAPFCILALWFGDDVMVLLYRGAEYEGFGHIVVVLCLATLVWALGTPPSNALASMERPRAILAINTGGMILMLIVMAILIASAGLDGAAYGWLAANAIISSAQWIGFRLVLRQGGDTSSVRQVMQALTGTTAAERWTIAHLGTGDHASVYAVRVRDGAPVWRHHRSVVIKLYKPEAGLSEDMVAEQFASLSRLHAAVNGLRVNDWTISSPEPLHICTSPLALVMTEIPGKIDLRSGTGHDPNLTHERLDELGRVLVGAMRDNWDRRKQHGDLGLQNMLYDLEDRQLSLVDPGTRECCVVCNEASRRWSPAILELGHILRDLGTDVRNLTGNPLARMRRELFIKSALRTYIATIDTAADRHRALQEIRACALYHLAKVLAPSWTLRGLLRGPLTRFVERRTDQILAELGGDLAGIALPPPQGLGAPAVTAAAPIGTHFSPLLAPATKAVASEPAAAGRLEATVR